MTKQLPPSRSHRLLLESGAVGDAATLRRASTRDLIISRALTRLRIYRAPPKLNFFQRAQAARVFAEAHAPFDTTGTLILRTKIGAEIWYWDQSKLAALAPLGHVLPESIWRAAGDGWRILRCAEGVEAQYWEGGCLQASTWRRQDFSADQWRTFVLSVAKPALAAPSDPPPTIDLAMSETAWRWRVVAPAPSWGDAERASLTVAICAAAVTAFLCGQAIKSSAIAHREQARIEAIEQRFREDARLSEAVEQHRLLTEYARATQQRHVLIAATEAHEVLSRFGLQAETWRISNGRMSLIVNGALGETPVRDVVRDIDEADHLCAAMPEIAGAGRFEIRANVKAPEAPCPATARAGVRG
jgi:hypothetical protein